MPIENQKCSGCGFVHPPPYGEACPIALANQQKKEGARSKNEQLIKRFIEALQIEDETKYNKLTSMVDKILKAYGK